jgi:hypothetical protein
VAWTLGKASPSGRRGRSILRIRAASREDSSSERHLDWNTYAIVAIIELARGKGKNPEVPTWLEEDYRRAIRELAEIGAAEIWRTDEPDAVLSILGIIAIAKGLRTHGKFLVMYSEDELLEIESRAGF